MNIVLYYILCTDIDLGTSSWKKRSLEFAPNRFGAEWINRLAPVLGLDCSSNQKKKKALDVLDGMYRLLIKRYRDVVEHHEKSRLELTSD